MTNREEARRILLSRAVKDRGLPQRLRAIQIAEEFGIGLSTVWLFAKQGKLTPIKISSRITVFETSEVMELFGEDFGI